VEVPGTLDQAVEALGTGGRVILLAVGGPAEKIPFLVTNALGVAYEACTHGAPGTLLLGLSKEVCDFATRQQVVSLRACVWTTFLNTSTDWWINVDRSLDDYMRMCHARIHVFNLLLQLERKVEVMFSDTDVCYSKNPFPALEATGQSLLTSGRMRNFNLGTMFGRNDLGAGRDALQIVQESDERLAYFRGLGRNDSRLTALHSRGMWDQGLVNDVLEGYQVGEEIWTRSCLNKDDQCIIAACCRPGMPLDFVKRPSEQVKAHSDILGDGNEIGMGSCIGPSQVQELAEQGKSVAGIVHRNICGNGVGRYDKDGKPINHIEWLRRINCWHAPM
jgi:hypothetical protein